MEVNCSFTSSYHDLFVAQWSLTPLYIYTSSTAQGGGGSFKNRKPIGDVRCCESRMAERIR